MTQRRVYLGRTVELVFGVGLGGKPLSPMELMGYAKSGHLRELLGCGSVPPDTIRKMPMRDFGWWSNHGEIPKKVWQPLHTYSGLDFDILIATCLAYVWTYPGRHPDFDEAAMTYLSGLFIVLAGTRVVANESGLAWVDPVSTDTTVFVPHAMIMDMGLIRTRRNKRVSSGSNPSIT